MVDTIAGEVLLIGNFLSHTGAVRGVCEDLAVHLKKSGWQVTTTSRRIARASRLVDMLMTAWSQSARYQVAHIDLFSGLSFIWAELVVLLLRLVKKPYVITLRGGNLPVFAKKRAKRTARLLAGAAVVTVPSRFLLESMKPFRQDLYLLPNPIDLNQYRYRLRDHATPRLIWVRAFHEVYNPSLAPKVVAALQNDYPACSLTMVGPDKRDGSYEATVKMAQMLGVQDRIQAIGGVPKSEVPVWLEKGDIFLNTTHVDNTPVTVMEAMACGLCIVSTNVGGIPYLLAHDHDALLVPPNDSEAMAYAIRRILTEPDLAPRLSSNARAKAEQFDWDKILPQWEMIFSDVITTTSVSSALNTLYDHKT